MVDSKQQWKAWIYLAPALILLAIFTVWPIFNTINQAFLEDYNPLAAQGGQTFNYGFKNFESVINDGDFLNSIKTTVLLTALTVPISCFLGLIIAVFLNSITKFSKLLQTIYFLTYVTNSIAIGMVFKMMFDIIGLSSASKPYIDAGGEFYYITTTVGSIKAMRATSWGYINNFIMALGFDPIVWTNGPSTYAANIFVMTVYIVWNALPFKILILLGGLQSVNKQYYDAAKIDGASRGRVFRKITVPLLSPMIAYVVITSFIGGFKEYSSIVGVFGEKMMEWRLITMVGFINRKLLEGDPNHGVASAGALLLFALIMVVTLINLFVSKKKVHY